MIKYFLKLKSISKIWWVSILQICIIILTAAQQSEVYLNCGITFRPIIFYESVMEQTILFICLYVVCIMGLAGLWRHKGSIYFVIYTIFLTTLCIFQFIDIMMSMVFYKYKMLKPESVQALLVKLYTEYRQNESSAGYRTNMMHSCLKCCGVKGPFGKEVIVKKTIIAYIIPSCCPYGQEDCTPLQAYQENCTSRLINEATDYFTYIQLAFANGVLQLVTSRVVLHKYV